MHASTGDTATAPSASTAQTARTFADLVRIIESKLMPDDPDEPADPRWTGPGRSARGTINAFVRRLASAERHVEHLIRADLADAADATPSTSTPQQVTVVDLHMLHDRAKRFVVGVVLRQAFDAKEAAGTALPLQFVVLDELNKYAPRDSSSPIKEILLDVAERGRSLGMILIGAQQTASEVERRVVANSAVRVVGRLDSRRGRARPVRVPARGAAPAGDDPQAGLDVRLPAPPAGPAAARVPVPGVGDPRRPRPTSSAARRRRRTGSSLSRRPVRRADCCRADREAAAHLRLARRQGHPRRLPRRRAPRRARRDRRRSPSAEAVDLVVVAGDLFDSAAPTPESEEIVYRALLGLAGTGADVAVIAGNHDNARRLRAVAPLLALGRVHLVAEPTRPDDGGVLPLRARDGVDVRLAMLPFVSKRGIVRAEHLMDRRGVRERPALQPSGCAC